MVYLFITRAPGNTGDRSHLSSKDLSLWIIPSQQHSCPESSKCLTVRPDGVGSKEGCDAFVCWKSQRGWSSAEPTEGRGQTSLTTTKIRGGCATIYNLLCQLHDSREGETGSGAERQRGRRTEGGLWIHTAQQKTTVSDWSHLWSLY